jgi:hypothetical protein
MSKHLQDIKLTYCEHARRSAGIGIMLISAGVLAMVHALLPDLFVDSSSRLIRKLNNKIENSPENL